MSVEWAAPNVDLDIHLLLPSRQGWPERICYNSVGTLDAAPWGQLESDIRAGGGAPEVLRLTKLLDGQYQVWVHNFTRPDRLPRPTTFKLTARGQLIQLQPPNEGGGAWHLLNLDGTSGTIAIINTIHQTLPMLAPHRRPDTATDERGSLARGNGSN